MSIEDCSFLSGQISSLLEVEDPINSSYMLEVSSGGVARPLTILEDYISFKGNKANIILKEKFMGKKTYNGYLEGTDENGFIILKTQDCKMKINFSEINKANIDLNWAIENKSYN